MRDMGSNKREKDVMFDEKRRVHFQNRSAKKSICFP